MIGPTVSIDTTFVDGEVALRRMIPASHSALLHLDFGIVAGAVIRDLGSIR